MTKVSVIVPIYKTEKYLPQCLDSILSQSYRDIEVILVDDGSPDACPQICDAYAEKDGRVTVIHKQNGGLADARNKGIEYATGELGIFIDSDDFWDDPDGLRKLMDRQKEKAAEVQCFGYYKKNENTGRIIKAADNAESMPEILCKREDQLEYLFDRGLYVASAWNKLIAMNILKALPFPKGKIAEDVGWCAHLIQDARSFDYINCSFYCYRQRNDSITSRFTEKSCNDLKDAIIECCLLEEKADPKIKPMIGRYAAYQFSTFIAVQALAEELPRKCISELNAYKEILSFFQSSRKVKIMYLGTRLMGLMNWCRLIRATRFIWNPLRNVI